MPQSFHLPAAARALRVGVWAALAALLPVLAMASLVVSARLRGSLVVGMEAFLPPMLLGVGLQITSLVLLAMAARGVSNLRHTLWIGALALIAFPIPPLTTSVGLLAQLVGAHAVLQQAGHRTVTLPIAFVACLGCPAAALIIGVLLPGHDEVAMLVLLVILVVAVIVALDRAAELAPQPAPSNAFALAQPASRDDTPT